MTPNSATGWTQLFHRLSQAPATQDLLRRLEDGTLASIAGVSPGAHPFLAVLLRHLLPARAVVLVADGTKQLEAFLQDVQSWLTVSHPSPPNPNPDAAPAHRPLCFPSWEILPHEDTLPHADTISDRLDTLVTLAALPPAPSAAPPPVLVTTATALMQPTFHPEWLRRHIRSCKRGDHLDPLDLVEWLEDQGYEPEAQVNHKGEIALRGGILDVFPVNAPWPVRLEFFGDEIESLRTFDPVSQMSRNPVPAVLLPPAGELGLIKRHTRSNAAGTGEPFSDPVCLADYLPPGALLLLGDPQALESQAEQYTLQIPDNHPLLLPWNSVLDRFTQSGATPIRLPEPSTETPVDTDDTAAPTLDLPSLESFRPLVQRAAEPQVAEAQRREFFAQMHRWMRHGHDVRVFCNNEGEQQRFLEIWTEYGLDPDRPATHIAPLSRGFLCASGRLVVITDAEIFGRYKIQRPRRLKSHHAQSSRSLLDVDFTELEEGELVVHLEHGIGRYLGLVRQPAGYGSKPLEKSAVPAGELQECLAIEYAPSNPDQPPPRLYVPITEAHLVGKYVGAGKARPALSTLGGTRWRKAKDQAAQAVRDLAAELLAIQAARDSLPGHAHPPDTAWQREFENAFLFEETPDQWRAILETKTDLERPKPMDRLICGDVGYGKTEVAIRAAFKTILGGKQVALLVPTTVLAQQHFNTFGERMADYPVRVDLLSRFRTQGQQQATLRDLATGAVDLVIGTHRLIQKDVKFHDLGLVIIDEEQRFGVLHKEQFKRMRRLVDVLTLSATPIPRTLYLALTGARDMSTIETPPQDRLPVETIVSPYDERLIRSAIQRELNRQGQIFYLHNRVHDIESVAARLQDLVPHARIVIGHGQMHADQLEEVMTRFVNGEADLLLSTTIIESGLDIPNANTIIIDRADRFGLSDLYQLRGRVGRYKHQAYAYLLIPRHARMLTDARKRISAIKQYASLGSGFKIAMRDLEIRGAGNLLGPQQSGHITAVGFDLYCQLLKQSVASLKGQPIPQRVDIPVRLDFLPLNPDDDASSVPGVAHAHLPPQYIADPKLRVDAYRKLGEITGDTDLDQLKNEWRDRFGPVPPQADLLLQVASLKLIAHRKHINSIESRDGKVMLTRNRDLLTVGGKFPRLTRKDPKAKLNEIARLIRTL